jgi:hypothetical protein
MIKKEVPTGFGNVRNRCFFAVKHPVSGNTIECIKVSDEKAIFIFPKRSKSLSMRTAQVVWTEHNCLKN